MSDQPDTWAQVEIMGHRVRFGRIVEAEQFGAKGVRIDVPMDEPGVFTSEFYAGAAIFSVTPCTEETARAYAEQRRRWDRPCEPLSLPPPQRFSEPDDPDTDDCEGCGAVVPIEDLETPEGEIVQLCPECRRKLNEGAIADDSQADLPLPGPTKDTVAVAGDEADGLASHG